MHHSEAINNFVEAVKSAIEAALDEGQPRIATELLAILNEMELKAGSRATYRRVPLARYLRPEIHVASSTRNLRPTLAETQPLQWRQVRTTCGQQGSFAVRNSIIFIRDGAGKEHVRGCGGSDAHHLAIANWVIAGGDPERRPII